MDQPTVVEIDEHLDNRARKVRVHGELLSRPVHRAAEAAQLAGDGAAAFRLPFPHLGDEILARIVGALVLPRLELALDHHLRGDTGVIGADHPQRILAAQPLVTNHHVLQRVVERVADVQAAGDVGRRVDDRERLRVRPFRPEQAVSLPVRIPARFDRGGIEGLGQRGGCVGGGCLGHGARLCQWGRRGASTAGAGTEVHRARRSVCHQVRRSAPPGIGIALHRTLFVVLLQRIVSPPAAVKVPSVPR